MNITGKTIREIVEENNMTKKEEEWLEKMVSMMMTLRKYIRLNDLDDKK